MAAPSTYITIIKAFPYRLNTAEEWSNSYALTGSTPADSTAWRTLFDALVAEEKKLYVANTNVIAGYGYNKIPVKGDHAIWHVDLRVSPNTPVAGSASIVSGNELHGDEAAWVRWGLDRFSSSGKRVYLRKYYHDGVGGPGNSVLTASYTTALNAFGAKMEDGSFAGGRKICDKDGNVPIGHAVSSYPTTRTLKRRGKRPPTT